MRVPLRVEYLNDGRYPSRRHKHEVGETVPMYAYEELVHDQLSSLGLERRTGTHRRPSRNLYLLVLA